MNTPIAITACDLLTPLDSPGSPGTRTWDAILRGESIRARHAIHDDLLAGPHDLDRSIRIAISIAQRAVRRLHLDENTHLFCATSKGPVGTMLAALDRLRDNLPLTDSQARHIALGTGAIGPLLAEHLKLRGPVHTSVAACASGLHALHHAAQSLWRNECQRALVVAADASLHPLFEASFQRLGILAPKDSQGIQRCHPFGENGEGFFITEAGAALLLEKPHSCGAGVPPAVPPANQPLAFLEHSWIGADSTALIAIDPDTHSLRHGINSASTTDPPAFLHAHATGTAHDRFELAAIRSIFGPRVPVFSSKRWLGHSLGAAGLVSVGLSLHCHRHHQTLEGDPVEPATTSLTVAQGFGGHIGIIALRGVSGHP